MTAGLETEKGRWRGVSREERLCKNCQSGEVKDVELFVEMQQYGGGEGEADVVDEG